VGFVPAEESTYLAEVLKCLELKSIAVDGFCGEK